jgi:hypothetical protein
MEKQYYTLKEALSIAQEIDPRVPQLRSLSRWRVHRCIPGPVMYSYDSGRVGLYTEELVISLLVTTKLNKDRGFSIYEIANAYAAYQSTGMGPMTIITTTNEMSTDRAYEAFTAYKQVRHEVESMLREKQLQVKLKHDRILGK